MLYRNEDAIEFTADIDGEDYEFTIAYAMAQEMDHLGRNMWIVDYWRVIKVNDKPNVLGDFWREQLNEEAVEDAIIEQEAE